MFKQLDYKLNYNKLKYFINLILFFGFTHTYAQQDDTGRKLKLDQNKQLRIEYKFSAWNKNLKQRDSASLLLRDSTSGKMARIELLETAENSAEFVGFYSISFGSQEVIPEIYLPPQDMVKSSEKLKQLSELIKDGILLRKPFFLRQEKNIQAITVFDTKDQALFAFEQFRLGIKGKAIIEKAALEAQKNAQLALEQKKLAELALAQEMERVHLAQLEKERQEELKRQQQQLAEQEKQARKAKAKQLAELAMKAYNANNFAEAEKLFKQSTELDPENTAYYYQYGVTLFRNEKYNESLVLLNLAKDLPEETQLEKKFFMGLNYMKLKEYESAHDLFDQVKSANHKRISPMSSFYNGVLDFQKEKYDISKKYFEYVLDNSEDSKLDEQAEAYIEQIIQIQQFKARQAQKFSITVNVGADYESNVLTLSNGTEADTESGKAGLRGIYSFLGEYRPLLTETHQYSMFLSYSDYYTVGTNLKAEAAFTNADPMTVSLYTPYTYIGKMFNRGFHLSLTPGYDITYMNADTEGSRENILNSAYLKIDQTYVMSDDYFASYNLELRSDTSLLDVSETEDSSASKITFTSAHTHFKDKKKTEANIYEGSVIMNAAKGDNKIYNKLNLAYTYLMPWREKLSLTGRADLYYSLYPNHESDRADNGLILTGALRQPINDDFTASYTTTYTLNNSSVDTSAYTNITLMAMLTWTKGF